MIKQRWFWAGLVIGSAAVFGVSCSEESDDNNSESSGGTGGDVTFQDTGGTEEGGANGSGATDSGLDPCPTLEGLDDCGTTQLSADFRNPNVMLVIDKSGSMADEGFGSTKWQALREALDDALKEVARNISFGLIMYPYNEDDPIPERCSSGCCNVEEGDDAVNVSIQPGESAVAKIISALDATEPGGGTPTAAALERALTYYTEGEGADLAGEKYVLLATDGGPNCNSLLYCEADQCTTNMDDECATDNCCTGSSGAALCLDDDAVRDAIVELAQAGIPTFVVGIPGSEAYSSYLDEFAVLGERPNSGDTDYYAVEAGGDVSGLTQTFSDISTQLLHSCDIELKNDIPNRDQVNIALECTPIPQNDSDGDPNWELDTSSSPNKIIMLGDECDRILEEGVERVDVVLGCPTIQ